MKKLLLLSLTVLYTNLFAQNVGINTPSPQTTLDVKGAYRNQPLYLTGSGNSLIIPDNNSNINLSGIFSGEFSATINIPVDGQKLIIDNNSNQTGILSGTVDIRKGLNEYTFSDGEWKVVNTNAWSLQGNFNTNPAYNYIGTADKNDVIFKRYNEERLRITESELQINTGAKVSGKISISNDINTPVAGSIRYNAESQEFEGYNGFFWESFTTKKTNGGWGNIASTETQSLIEDTPVSASYLGTSVSSADNFIIAGAPNGNDNKGFVTIYRKNYTQWYRSQSLKPVVLATGDGFGSSVAIHNNTAIIGAPYTDVAGNANQGKVYIYDFSGSVFTLTAELVAPDGQPEEYFGRSVSIFGDYAVVSGAHTRQASFPVPPPMPISKAYIFKKTGGVWALHTSINVNSTEVVSFGSSISIDNDFLAIGASGYQENEGKVYFYQLLGGVWSQHSIITRPVFQYNDSFGFSVALKNQKLIIGAPDGQTNNGVGTAFLYHFDGTSWLLNSTIKGSDWFSGDRFGTSVSLNDNVAVIGANGIHVSGYKNGKAYIFKNHGNIWKQEAILNASDGKLSNSFGVGVTVNTNNAVCIGASGFDEGAISNCGKLYFFNQN